MSALNVVVNVLLITAAAAATVSAVQSVRTYREAKATTVRMNKANNAFEQTIIKNLFDIGGQEMVDDYKRRCADGDK